MGAIFIADHHLVLVLACSVLWMCPCIPLVQSAYHIICHISTFGCSHYIIGAPNFVLVEAKVKLSQKHFELIHTLQPANVAVISLKYSHERLTIYINNAFLWGTSGVDSSTEESTSRWTTYHLASCSKQITFYIVLLCSPYQFYLPN